MTIVFSLGDSDAGRADVCMSMLVVLVSCVMLVEKELGIDRIGMCEHLVVISVWCNCSWLKRERQCIE